MTSRLGEREMKLISSVEELRQMLTHLNNSNPDLVSVDAEGWRLCRDGTLSLLALTWDERIIYVIDVQVGPGYKYGASDFSSFCNGSQNIKPQKKMSAFWQIRWHQKSKMV